MGRSRRSFVSLTKVTNTSCAAGYFLVGNPGCGWKMKSEDPIWFTSEIQHRYWIFKRSHLFQGPSSFWVCMLVFGGVHVSYFVGIWIKPFTLPEANELRNSTLGLVQMSFHFGFRPPARWYVSFGENKSLVGFCSVSFCWDLENKEEGFKMSCEGVAPTVFPTVGIVIHLESWDLNT